MRGIVVVDQPEVEKERLARPFLAAGRGDVAREFPPGWPAAGAEGVAA